MSRRIQQQEADKLQYVPTPPTYEAQTRYGNTCEGGSYQITFDYPCDSTEPFAAHLTFSSADGGGCLSIRLTSSGEYVSDNELGDCYISDSLEDVLPWVVTDGWQTHIEALQIVRRHLDTSDTGGALAQAAQCAASGGF
jgi:hypothetical protein